MRIKEVRGKILLTLLLLLIYRLGCWIPIPGLSSEAFSTAAGSNSFLGLLSSISGGALSNGSLLALGVSPYISASIITQLLTFAVPSMQRMAKQGEEGQKKIEKITRWAALLLALAQAIGIVVSFSSNSLLDDRAVWSENLYWLVAAIVVIVLVAGGMFTVWLGERITALGIGNGTSLLIFVGVLSSAGTSLLDAFQGLGTSEWSTYLWTILIFLVAVIVIFGSIVFIDLSERKVPVQYAKQIKGRKMYGGQTNNIPIRVNASGVMPIIFASALLTFPQLIISIFAPKSGAMTWYNEWLGAGSWVNIVCSSLLILFFAYFWSMMTFNTEDIAKQIQQNGGFIPGIRPGKATSDHLRRISNRITLFGAIFLALIALVPNLVFKALPLGGDSLVSAFSATGLLIVVSCALEFDKQLDAQLLMKNYRGFLK